ncbi:helix-turn-helix domain-containing protein [Chloroflexota bacterium]
MCALLVKLQNEEMQAHFAALGNGKRNYTSQQKNFLLLHIDTYGVRATSRIIGIPRRTIQRWCRRYNKQVKRCPAWVYDWAERRRKRREFWERRRYYR